MTRLIPLLALALLAPFSATANTAQCEVDGQLVPCPQPPTVQIMLEGRRGPVVRFACELEPYAVQVVNRRGRVTKKVELLLHAFPEDEPLRVWVGKRGPRDAQEVNAIIARACDE